MGKNWIVIAAMLAGALAGCNQGSGVELSPSNVLITPPTPTPCPANPAVRRINCGGPAFTDSCGVAWSADQAYAAGGWGYVGAPAIGGPGNGTVSNSPNDPLYWNERYGDPLDYKITVPNGTYNVSLGMAERYFNNAGMRSFTISIEGVAVETNLDLFAAAGGKDIAYDRTYVVTVSDGVIDINLLAATDNGLLNWIEVK